MSQKCRRNRGVMMKRFFMDIRQNLRCQMYWMTLKRIAYFAINIDNAPTLLHKVENLIRIQSKGFTPKENK